MDFYSLYVRFRTDLAVNAKSFVNSNNIPADQGRMRVISCTRTGECVIISENWYAFLPEDAGRIQTIRAARDAADCIALSNDEDGVADWIETNIL